MKRKKREESCHFTWQEPEENFRGDRSKGGKHIYPAVESQSHLYFMDIESLSCMGAGGCHQKKKKKKMSEHHQHFNILNILKLINAYYCYQFIKQSKSL